MNLNSFNIEIYMIINFRIHEISLDAYQLLQTPIVNKKKLFQWVFLV